VFLGKRWQIQSPGNQVEINSGSQFIFSITYQDVIVQDGDKNVPENVTDNGKMSQTESKNVPETGKMSQNAQGLVPVL
jgi:hypothetical protein